MTYLGSPPASQAFAPGTDTFNGDGTTVAFTLSRNVSTVNDIQVVVNNVVQQPTAYTVSGSTLTFTAAPSSGTNNIYVRYLSTNLLTVAPSQASVGVSQLSATGTANSTTYLRGDNTWALVSGFDSGTLMLFVQTAAPTGWTKSTTHDNKALRVVSGAASSGGTVAFTTAFTSQAASGTVGSTTLVEAQMPSHSHNNGMTGPGSIAQAPAPSIMGSTGGIAAYRNATQATGGGGSHNHTFTGSSIDLAVQYVDVIIASKN